MISRLSNFIQHHSWVFVPGIVFITSVSVACYLVIGNHFPLGANGSPRQSPFAQLLKNPPEAQPLFLPIVMYHYVEVVKDDKDFIRKSLAVTPPTFEAEIKNIKAQKYQTIFAKELPQIIGGNSAFYSKNTKYLALTFDDGYEDFYTDAFPILKKYQVKGTLYVVTSFIGKSGYVTEKQLKELVDSGLVEIGSHTLHHTVLGSASVVGATSEIVESKQLLEKLLHTPIYSFAYPFGSYNVETKRLVQEAGYTNAVTVKVGTTQAPTDLYTLYRIRAGALRTLGL